jgi:tetratricopeptide (TPR) repeat protein
MEKAIKIDPQFAMAYRSMAWSSGQLWGLSKWHEYMGKAVEFSHRLSDRESYIIQGDFYRGSEKTLEKAIEAFKKVLELYPYDLNANISAALTYQDLGKWDKMIERYEAAIWNKPDYNIAYGNLGLSYAYQGDYEKARKTFEYFINNFRDDQYIRSCYAKNYYFQRKFDLALIEAEKAISLKPKLYQPLERKGEIYFYMGNFSQAEKVFRGLLEFPEPLAQLEAIESIGFIYLTQGRLADAEKQFKQALKLAKEKLKARQDRPHLYIGNIYLIRKKYEQGLKEFNEFLVQNKDWPIAQLWGLYFTAITYLELKSPGQIQQAEAAFLEWANNRANKTLIRWYYLFLGKKELKQKNYSRAIEYLNRARSVYANFADAPRILDPLAWAYLESGDLENAQKTFEKITTQTEGRRNNGIIYVKAFYNLGKIYQEKGWKGKAIENYNKFIELWKDCDPIFQPLLKDARKQVINLQE